MLRYEQLLLENKAWAQEMQQADPKFFERLSATQTPEILWIGCSDSRVSPDEITEIKPGEVFIHRNIANLVVHTDMNLLSVLQYAVEVLKVKDVVVCGHYGCGGVKAALGNESLGVIDAWLRQIKDVYRIHSEEIDLHTDETAKVNRLVEYNVKEQLFNLAKTSIIQNAWKQNNFPYLHGWVFDMGDGVIKPMLELAPNAPFGNPIYQFNNLDK